MINLTEIIKNQINYGTMDKKVLKERVDVMFICGTFTSEEYQEICNLFLEKENEKKKLEELQTKNSIEEHKEEVTQ